MLDKDVLKSDKLGNLDVELDGLAYHDSVDFEAQKLQGTGAGSGTLSFTVSWVPESWAGGSV